MSLLPQDHEGFNGNHATRGHEARADETLICSRCRRIDFGAIFDYSELIPMDGLNVMPEEFFGSETESQTCPVCCLFAASRGPGSYEQYELRMHSGFGLHDQEESRSHATAANCIALSVLGKSSYVKSGGSNFGLIARVLPHAAEGLAGRGDFLGSIVQPDRIDFTVVNGWLRHCMEEHGTGCNSSSPGKYPQSFRVIDCDDLTLVQWDSLSKEKDYFTLSYMWSSATSTVEDLTFRTTLCRDALPQVIIDAVEVVKRIRLTGSRYLWVDRYCINQDDADEKHIQIKAMDVIYEGSFATIVAASETRETAGLPGMGYSARATQPSAVVNGITLVSTMPRLDWFLSETPWGQRGWTYQEAVLSRRCLVFTDFQLYSSCRVSTCCEAIIKDPNLTSVRDQLPMSLFETPRLTESGRQNSYKRLAEHITQYSQRILTYETDGLNAFRGILARSYYYTYWGIPILETRSGDVNAGFAAGLCWEQPRGKSRKPSLPSWSWTGWSGRIRHHEKINIKIDYPVEIWVETDSHARIPLEKIVQMANSLVIQELSNFIHLSVPVVRLKLQEKQADGYWTSSFESDATGVLCFDHLDEICQECEQNEDNSSLIYLSLSPGRDHDVFGSYWDALILPWHNVGTKLLFIEQHGDYASRVGITQAPVRKVDRVSKTLRTIRLG